jgi:hypothetical protein
MTRYEAANGPMIEDPECGRPKDHNGPCRTRPAVARKYAADTARLAAAVQPCACECGEEALWGHQYRRGHNPRNAWGYWTMPAPESAARRTA